MYGHLPEQDIMHSEFIGLKLPKKKKKKISPRRPCLRGMGVGLGETIGPLGSLNIFPKSWSVVKEETSNIA